MNISTFVYIFNKLYKKFDSLVNEMCTYFGTEDLDILSVYQIDKKSFLFDTRSSRMFDSFCRWTGKAVPDVLTLLPLSTSWNMAQNQCRRCFLTRNWVKRTSNILELNKTRHVQVSSWKMGVRCRG
jgi:hypothetical protein